MKTILVTGASGQLGQCFQRLSVKYPRLEFLFVNSSEIDITDRLMLSYIFAAKEFQYCINCAAYTNVEKAETEKQKVFSINSEAVKKLAVMCKNHNTVLIHFSTDYVFDGTSKKPYSETDETNPLNVYGSSKLQGEECIRKFLDKYFILRTSWLYSQHGNNFLKTIIKKAKEHTPLNITTSQTGTPTNANDLAKFVLDIISEENRNFGLYHYSNLGEATWYDFAEEILRFSGKTSQVKLNKSNEYKTVAVRPAYSVLDKSKLQKTFNWHLPDWKESLKKLMKDQN